MSNPVPLYPHVPAPDYALVDGLRRHRLGGVLDMLYRRLGCAQRWRLARPLLATALRLEGGAVWSQTARNWMWRYHGVSIGAYSYGELFDPALTPPGVVIGRYCSLAPGVRFHPQNHPLDRLTTHPFFYDRRLGLLDHDHLDPALITVGSDVWMGRNVMVTPGCKTIGHGAIVGTGAVVTRDVPPYAVVGGNPAKIIKYRFDEPMIAELLASQWWQRDIRSLAQSLPHLLKRLDHEGLQAILHQNEPNR
jgi:virginiamycin A acetyltransferase